MSIKCILLEAKKKKKWAIFKNYIISVKVGKRYNRVTLQKFTKEISKHFKDEKLFLNDNSMPPKVSGGKLF